MQIRQDFLSNLLSIMAMRLIASLVRKKVFLCQITRRICGCCSTSVSSLKLQWEEVKDKSEDEIHQTLFPRKKQESIQVKPDFNEMLKDYDRIPGMTKKGPLGRLRQRGAGDRRNSLSVLSVL